MVDFSIWKVAAFYLLAATVLGSALLVVCMRNIVHAVLFLAVCFIAMAGIFLTLDADFLAAVQVLVYAGAVCIMVVFGIMLIQREDMQYSNPFNHQIAIGAGLAALVVTWLGYYAAKTSWGTTFVPVPADTVGNIANIMLNKYVIPFEVAAILLTVALVGAILLAREVKTDDADR